MRTVTRSLELAIAPMLLAATAGALLFPTVYRDSDWVRVQFRAWDLLGLAVILPLLVVSGWRADRGYPRAHLLRLGALGYVTYTYATYAFSLRLNALFPLYVAIFGGSLYALIFALSQTDARAIRARLARDAPRRTVAAFLAVIGVGLLVVELRDVVAALVTGTVPELVRLAEHPTGVTYVLDLGVVVPACVLAAYWLWRNDPRGFVLGAVMLVKGITVGLSLAAMTAVVTTTGAQLDVVQLVLWGLMAGMSAGMLGRLLRPLRDTDRAQDQRPRERHHEVAA